MRTLAYLGGVLAVAQLLACEDPSPAIKRVLPDRLEATASGPASAPVAAGRLDGHGSYEIAAPAGEAATAVLRLWFWQGGPSLESLVYVDVVAAHRRVDGVGERYLDAAAFEVVGGTVGPSDRPASIDAALVEASVDLATGVTYARLQLRADETSEPVELEVEGFVTVACRTTPDALPAILAGAEEPDPPPACARVFDAIRHTPDDPTAPPPPWDPTVDDTPSDGSGRTPLD